MPKTTKGSKEYRKELIKMDALKIAFNMTGDPVFFDEYQVMQNHMIDLEKTRGGLVPVL
jgi:hypothetical protein